MNWSHDSYKLALHLCELPHIDSNSDNIDSILYEKYGIVDTDKFDKLIKDLLDLIFINKCTLTGTAYKGFSNGKEWFIKKKAIIIKRNPSQNENSIPKINDNPDSRNEESKKYIVRVYFKVNKEWEFPARDIDNARDIAARCTREGVWIVNSNGTEEFYPVAEIYKAKIIPVLLDRMIKNKKEEILYI